MSYLSFQPVLHDWCNKDRGMCYPVCELDNLAHKPHEGALGVQARISYRINK